MRKTREASVAGQCQICALREHGAYICTRWRRARTVNEVKKRIPVVRKFAAEDMRCPYYCRGMEDSHGREC